MSIIVRRTAAAKKRLGRADYRQATNKIVSFTDQAAAFLRGFF